MHRENKKKPAKYHPDPFNPNQGDYHHYVEDPVQIEIIQSTKPAVLLALLRKSPFFRLLYANSKVRPSRVRVLLEGLVYAGVMLFLILYFGG